MPRRKAWSSSSSPSPRPFAGDAKLTGVRAQRIHLGLADATGRQAPQAIEGSHFTLAADIVLKALGFDPEDLPTAFQAPELAVTRWGTMKIDHRSMMTNLPGVFAAGDIVRGASLVVWAIRDGRDAAEHIHAYVDAEGRGQRRSGRERRSSRRREPRPLAHFPHRPLAPEGERAGVRGAIG